MKKGFLIILLLIIFFSLAASAQADTKTIVPYLELEGAKDPTAGIPQYIRYIFIFSLGLVGIIAFIAMLMAAIGYVTSVGNPQKAAAAKDKIFSALLGMLILLGSYVLLNTINPDLLKFKIEIVGEKVVIGDTGPGGTETECRLTGAYWDKPEINVYPVRYEGSNDSDRVAATATVTFTLNKNCKNETYPVEPNKLEKVPHLQQKKSGPLPRICDGYFDSVAVVLPEEGEDENPKFSWQFTFYKHYPTRYEDKRCAGKFRKHATAPIDWSGGAECQSTDKRLCNFRQIEDYPPGQEIFYLEGAMQLKEDLPSQYVPKLIITVNDLDENGVCCR